MNLSINEKTTIANILDNENIPIVDFVSRDFDESMKQLKARLERVVKRREPKKKEKTDIVTTSGKVEYPTEPDPAKWSETDVAMWAKSMRFHPGLRASLKSCDGKLLREVYEMKQDAPQFLYRLIEDSKTNVSSDSSKTTTAAALSDNSLKFNLAHFNNFCRELNSLFTSYS